MKIFEAIEKFLRTYWGIASIITSLAIGITGGIKGFKNNIIREYNDSITATAKDKDMKMVSIQVDTLQRIVNRYINTQNSVNESTGEQMKSVVSTVGTMKEQIGLHIKNTATKEDLFIWMNAFEKKKRDEITDSVKHGFRYEKIR